MIRPELPTRSRLASPGRVLVSGIRNNNWSDAEIVKGGEKQQQKIASVCVSTWFETHKLQRGGLIQTTSPYPEALTSTKILLCVFAVVDASTTPFCYVSFSFMLMQPIQINDVRGLYLLSWQRL